MPKMSSLGPLTPFNPPSMDALQSYNVNRPDQPEVIWQPFYDYQNYAAAGQVQLTFFQTTVGAGGSTLANTNMRAAGQFPRPWEFLITGIQVFFRHAANPGSTAAAAAAPVNTNDVFLALQSLSWLELFIGSKAYLDDGPLVKFPMQYRVVSQYGVAGTFAAGTSIAVEMASTAGRYYAITPVKVPANQNFNVTLNWPVAVAVSAQARIGIQLDGFLYRLSQ